MQKNKLKKIVEVYQALPYIIYKKEFLIPQRPFLPRKNYLIGAQDNILGSYSKSFPHLVNEELIKRSADPLQHADLVKQYQEHFNNIRQQYVQKLKVYYEKYIYPFRRPPPTLALSYYKENKEKFELQWKNNGKKYSLSDIHSKFKNLPEDIKEQYILKQNEKLDQKLKIAAITQEKYRIPSVTIPKTHLLYLQETKQGPITIKMSKEYKELPEEIKRQYQQKRKIIKKKKEEQLVRFLSERGLTIDNFYNIKIICEQIQKLKKQLKKKKNNNIKNEKNKNIDDSLFQALENPLCLQQNQTTTSSQNESQSIQIIPVKKQQQIEQTRSQIKHYPGKVKESQVAQYQKNDAPQQPLKLERNPQPVRPKDENFDFDNQQIQVMQLKRRASQKKANLNKKNN